MKIQCDNEKRLMQIEMMNRELECQRMLEEQKEELRKEAELQIKDAADHDRDWIQAD